MSAIPSYFSWQNPEQVAALRVEMGPDRVTPMKDSISPELRELLGEELTSDPTTVHGLSNHLPMALVAKHRLGADSDELRRFAATYSRQLAPLARAKEPLDRATWKRAIGDSRAATELRSYFAHRVADDGVEVTLRSHLPSLLPGAGGAGFHGVIRLAYAIDAASTLQVAAGLAYFAEVARPLAALAPFGGTTRDPEEIFTALSSTSTWATPPSARLIDDAMHKVAGHESFAHAAASLEVDDDSEATLAACALRLHASTNNFTALHGVTGLAALSVVRPWIEDQQLVDRVAFQALLAAYLSIGAPAIWSDNQLEEFALSTTGDPTEVSVAAANSDDEHVAKLAYTTLTAFEKTRDPLYLAVASRAVGPTSSQDD